MEERATKGIDFGQKDDQPPQYSRALSRKFTKDFKNSKKNSRNIIKSDSESDESKEDTNEVNEEYDLSQFSARTVAMGTYHAIALLGERDLNLEFNPIIACVGLLKQIAEKIK